jgi:hypothetical protein
MSFRDRFLRRVDMLVACPRVRVMVASVGDGTPPATLDEIERKLARPLPPVVRAFYEQVSHVELVWSLLPEGSAGDTTRPPPGRTITAKERDNECSARGMIEGTGGIVEILPAVRVFDSPLSDFGIDWELEIDGRKQPANELCLFDYQFYYDQTGLLIDGDSCRAILGTDYWADAHGRSLSFERALDLTTDNLGYMGREYNAPVDAIEAELGILSRGRQLWNRYCDVPPA